MPVLSAKLFRMLYKHHHNTERKLANIGKFCILLFVNFYALMYGNPLLWQLIFICNRRTSPLMKEALALNFLGPFEPARL